MNRTLHYTAFFLGLAAIGWVGAGYIGSNPLALAITLLVGAFYLMGALELHRFQQATDTLARAVADMSDSPPGLGQWLDRLHPSLQNAVRLRIEGERVGLPGPALTPYLAGLLVLLGMLGTFLGMVVTLNGTGLAMESASDLLAIRSSLSAPMKGLGLAFGTSIAGVAASAMLGLVSALCRRDRLQAAQLLDTRIATTLRVFSLAHRRDESFRLLQRQAEAMPALVDRLQAMMAAMDRQSHALNERMVSSQDSFHGKAEAAYAGLALSIDRSLKESLTESARVAGATIQPIVEATMAGIAREAASLHGTVAHSVQDQLDGLSRNMRSSLDQAAETFAQNSASLLGTVGQAHEDLHATLASRDRQRLASWTGALESMASALQNEWQQAGARTQAHAQSTIAEIARLVQATAEAPRAAAEVIAEMRQKLSDSMVRDNAMLEERSRVMGTLGALLDAVNRASTEQRVAIDGLVAASAEVLDRAGSGFAEKVDAEAARMAGVGAQVTGSAVEVASLGEAFGFAVQLFGQSNEKLGSRLERLEGALAKSVARSDEQLAYCVAQAREVIDLSMMSQRQIVEDLQRIASRPVPVGSEA